MSPQSKRSRGGDGNRGNGARPADVARAALRTMAELTGRRPESVLGIRKDDDDGWIVTVEIVELSRIPTSTDLLGIYAVRVDDDGELVGYERIRRYVRGQAGGDDQ
jgi:Gas vesicle synthesis protein GvpO